MTSSAGSFGERLVAELGADVVTPGADLGTRRVWDWSGTPGAEPTALIRPRTTQEVSRALAFCHANRQAVVTQGGLTGLAGGANLFGGEVALSLERMSAVEEVDAVSGTITVHAGALVPRRPEAPRAPAPPVPPSLPAR